MYSKDKLNWLFVSLPVTSYDGAMNASIVLQAVGFHTYACQYTREIFGVPITPNTSATKMQAAAALNSDH
jgi:hypothetical protein